MNAPAAKRGGGTAPADDSGLPLAVELRPAPDVERALVALARHPHVVFFDSARRDAALGRYSFLAADPFDFVQLPADGGDALAVLASRLAPLAAPTRPELPLFQGGAVALLSYDLNRSLERVPAAAWDEFAAPALAFGLYDWVLAIDHWADRAWLISQGFPETEPAARHRRAEQRLGQALAWLDPADARPVPARADGGPDERIDPRDLAPQFAVPGPRGLTSNFSPDGYVAAVARAVEYVHAGDVFQVNLAQRLLFPAAGDALSLYLRLRRRNPATFAAYFDLGTFQLASASPERFLQVRERQVEARPIKGTRPRTARPEADLFAGDELQHSAKDRAENVMIVDLLRNDLSRVCTPQSVRVQQLCRLETYEYVQHLVSAVRGTLDARLGPLDLLRAAFPGGSITGAPKVRAMEIIAELEPTARGPYCGGLAYVGFDGNMDCSILIRTITAGRGWWQAPVGGGIVAQSMPLPEYEETWHKAAGLLRALVE